MCKPHLALAAAVCLLLLPGLCRSAPAPEPRFAVGVAGHLMHGGGSERVYALLHEAGIQSVREDAHWAYVERRANQLNIPRHWFTYLEQLERNGLQSMLILGYGNLHHGNGEKPRDDATRAAYARYAEHIAGTLRGRVAYYELWNEWDMEHPADPAFSRDYVRLVAAAAPRIRQQDPQATLLAGAVTSAGIESGFADRLIEQGVLDWVDGLSLHPYVHCRGRGRNTPEAWIAWMREVDERLTRLAGRPVPLYLTEMAWPAHDGDCGIDQDLQAAYLARSFLLARTLPNIKGMWWYDLRNDGTDPHEREHNFGLLDHAFREKPAFRTLASLSKLVAHARFLGFEPGTPPGVVLLRFASDREQLVAGWSTGKPRQITLTSHGAPGAGLQMTDSAAPTRSSVSNPQQWRCEEPAGLCRLTLELDAFPRIVVVDSLPSADQMNAAPTSMLPSPRSLR